MDISRRETDPNRPEEGIPKHELPTFVISDTGTVGMRAIPLGNQALVEQDDVPDFDIGRTRAVTGDLKHQRVLGVLVKRPHRLP